jgi:acylphosphatase
MGSVRKAREAAQARRFLVGGRVQGVGFRYFVEKIANGLGLTGYTRNLADGTVEVYAVGSPEKLSELSGSLWKGPRMADVRRVEEQEAPVVDYTDFRIEYFS